MILIVDDDAVVRSSLTFLLKRAGYAPEAVGGPREAMTVVRQTAPQLILLDMNFTLTTTGEEGIQLLRQIKVFRPEVPVILMTAWGSIQLAVQGMQAGAFDFITKPWNNLILLNTIRTALELSEQQKEEQKPLERLQGSVFPFDKIIGQSPALLNVLGTVARIAPTNASVLITGESGTGKELIAEAIHTYSPRAAEAFVKVNLGGLSQSLFESEMFGHKKGAFTDAYIDRTGRFELADRGTIFLDEIGDLELSCQVKLLRVLQDQTFEVLGDSRARKVDVRVVSATNRDLRELVAQRLFREDLFYRINLITVHLPPLRERREDIPLLARHFAQKQCEVNGLPRVEFAADALAYLQKLPFPGNIRELKNLVERTLLVCGKPVLQASDFRAQAEERTDPSPSPHAPLSGLTLDEIERQTILQALDTHKGNLSHVASALGISRAALYRRLEKYGLKVGDKF
ncbi:sigma-54 dependent transcriptional regulator [Parabacteroides sp. PF5-6]|uniref:sigma-54-dependent transcriptional regulator n=1 Tax=Parabacteroides sp. PF5-6 TaxID=1742403 RepID=UPI0024070278|nr:sigma-54 dependent transcriptional regulator [Parabacteroides sp. PF5-6]MDF9831484.1 two-component system NtrC family response regulator [Parabacteroides sp. PF5-6]